VKRIIGTKENTEYGVKLVIDVGGAARALFGAGDAYAAMICKRLGVAVAERSGSVEISGPSVAAAAAAEVFGALHELEKRGALDKQAVRAALDLREEGRLDELFVAGGDTVAVTSRGKAVKCRTPGQKLYVDAIHKNTVVLGIGPAGTGKTFLAVAMAVNEYKNRRIEKIILTRPAVEVGEKLGFLPGDLQQKVDPYLRPLYDALEELFGTEAYKRLLERGTIEVAPLAYMRGRTLSSAFIILDEGQNTTIEQMKMFLTRFSEGSKVVVNGDVTQVDLPENRMSGLKHAAKLLRDVPGIGIVTLTDKDVVRHELVQSIIRAYDKNNKEPE